MGGAFPDLLYIENLATGAFDQYKLSAGGVWLDVRGDRGTMVQWRYADGAAYLPSDDEVRRRRPAEAMK